MYYINIKEFSVLNIYRCFSCFFLFLFCVLALTEMSVKFMHNVNILAENYQYFFSFSFLQWV